MGVGVMRCIESGLSNIRILALLRATNLQVMDQQVTTGSLLNMLHSFTLQ